MSKKLTVHLDATSLYGSAMPDILKKFQSDVVGRTITEAGYIDDGGQAWPVLLLDNGTYIQASMDDEGNGPGVLFGNTGILCQTSFVKKPRKAK